MRPVEEPVRAAIWDLDGTLVDSREYHWQAWVETLAAEGVLLKPEDFEATYGQRNSSFLPDWLGAGTSQSRLQRVAGTKEARFRQLVELRGCSPMPGSIEWVRELDTRGWLQAIVSSAPRLNIDCILKVLSLTRYFRTIVAAEDVKVSKPDPEGFLLASARLNVAPLRCIVVEDTAGGIEGARRAGMASIGVSAASSVLPATLCVSSLESLASDSFEKLLVCHRRE
jgi:beta-phosphoglucomutase